VASTSSATESIVSGVELGGLSTTGQPTASAGEAERKVERADRGDSADRKTPDDRDAAARGRVQVERNDLAVLALGLFGGEAEGERAALDLDGGVLDRLPCLGGELARELVAPLEQPS